jgi:hypothetical protein
LTVAAAVCDAQRDADVLQRAHAFRLAAATLSSSAAPHVHEAVVARLPTHMAPANLSGARAGAQPRPVFL